MAKFCSNNPGGWLRSIRLLALLVLLLPLARTAQATTIDIMLVYDNTASTWVASNGGMTTFSQDVVTRMNQAMENSGIDATFRLVHSMQVNYNHTALDTDLDELTAGSGAFSVVDSARDTYGADLVAMLVDTGSASGWVGLGWMMTGWSGSPAWGLTTNSIRSVETSHTLTHEVGHNLGADHSKYQTADPGPNDYLDGQYSAGWYFTGTDGVAYNTIMAYDDDGYGNRYTEAPLFSNPLETYQDTAAGDAANGDNARLIEQTKDIIAAYRTAAVDPDPVDPDPVDPDPVDPDPFSSSTAFVAQQFRDFFDREGESFAVASWVEFMDAGILTRADVVEAFLDAVEYDEVIGPVVRLYFGYFNRIPDTGGIFFYLNELRRGVNQLVDISQNFTLSPEFKTTYGPLDDEDFVNLVYQNVLGRQAEPNGLAFYVERLEAGESRGLIMLNFSDSPEYKSRSYDWVQVVKLYTGLLRRTPTQTEFENDVSRLSSGTHSMAVLIDNILNSSEYAARF